MNDLHRPAILPDEYGASYLSFVSLINSTTESELVRKLREKNPATPLAATYMLMARLAGISHMDVIQKHSLKPFFAGFERNQKTHLQRSENDHVRRKSDLFPARWALFFCEECAQEDVKVWGRSYWRRTHQVPGVCWCPKHEGTLARHSADLSDQPHTLSGVASPCIQGPIPTAQSIERAYLDVVAELFVLSRPVYIKKLQRCLSPIASSLGITCVPDDSKKVLLSDRVAQHCSNEWCRQVFPTFARKLPRQHFSAIDDSLSDPTLKATTYSLALALICHGEKRRSRLLKYCSEPVSERQWRLQHS